MIKTHLLVLNIIGCLHDPANVQH